MAEPRNHQYRIGGGTEVGGGGGGGGACAPTLFYLGGQCLIHQNVNTPPPVCSIIIHVDMVFCGEETG